MSALADLAGAVQLRYLYLHGGDDLATDVIEYVFVTRRPVHRCDLGDPTFQRGNLTSTKRHGIDDVVPTLAVHTPYSTSADRSTTAQQLYAMLGRW